MNQLNKTLYPALLKTIDSLPVANIATNRIQVLDDIVSYLQQKVKQHEPILLNFICTHNSRRSHLSQCWAQTAASYFGVPHVQCYSGGTEATALFPLVAKTLTDQGFSISILSQGDNPVFAIKYASNEAPIIGFSKIYHHHYNPSTNYIAIMTCSEADENCPLVQGAEAKFALTYEDPKKFDGSPQMNEKYYERSLQIAAELFYVFSKIQYRHEQ